MAGRLAGKRILVVEDEYFIAHDLKRVLQNEDAIVIGPASDLARGLALMEELPLDAAVLDVNLDGANSYPIADRLDAQAVPYMFLTGYSDDALPEPYRRVPYLLKPFSFQTVLACVGRLIEGETR